MYYQVLKKKKLLLLGFFKERKRNYIPHLRSVSESAELCLLVINSLFMGARCSSVIRAFAHGAMGRRIDHS